MLGLGNQLVRTFNYTHYTSTKHNNISKRFIYYDNCYIIITVITVHKLGEKCVLAQWNKAYLHSILNVRIIIVCKNVK